MSSILLKNIGHKNNKKDILIVDNFINKIDDFINFPADEIIECGGKQVIPGLINMHTHSAMSLMRGIKEDVSLFEWLDEIWKIEKKIDDQVIECGTRLACLEMIKTGTTTFNDLYWRINVASKVVNEMGIRATHAYVFLDGGDEKKAEREREEVQKIFEDSKKWGELSTFAIGPHAPYTVRDENMIWAIEFAKKNELNLHIHISETQKEMEDYYKTYGMSPIKRLDEMGGIHEKTIVAHGLWLSEEDIDILGSRRACVVHNVNSNLKLASGYKFKYKELEDAGAIVTLGTDGAASSNNLDMLETMKTSALLQKAWRKDPSALPINNLMDMATKNAANTLGLKTGRIEEGYLADLVLVDTESYAFCPPTNFLANLVYSANSSCVDTVICNGKVVMRNRKVDGEEEILEQANRILKKIY